MGFSKEVMRDKARRRIKEEDPTILIGSPMCRDWCQMMQINWPKMSPLEKAKRLEETRQHIKFVCSLYRDQHQRGTYYMHEHPAQAKSWHEADISHLEKDTLGKHVDV